MTTWGDYPQFLRDNANGWVVAYIGKERTLKTPLFVNVTGPFDTKEEAQQAAAAMRRRYHRAEKRGDPLPSIMVSVHVRPLWNTDIKE